MKKRLLALLLAIMAICPLITACSDSYYQYDSYLDFINLGDPSKVEITEADIENGILAKYYSYFSQDITDKKLVSTSLTSGEVKYGDTVNIDYKGYKIGETTPFEGGSTYDDNGKAKGTDLEIGSNSYIEGFESGLIGHEVGETVALYLTFPETYSSTELAGKRVRFDVVINKISKRYPYPEMTDEKIKEKSEGEFETVAAFKESARKDVIKNEIWKDFYEMCKIKKWPEQELKDYYYTSLEQHKNTANYFYGDLDSYAAAMGYSDGNTLRAYVMSQARQQCKQDVMVLALVEKYELQLSEAELEKEMKALHKEAVEKEDFEGSYKEYLKTYDESAVRISVYTDVVMDFLMTKNTIENNLGKNGFYGIPSKGIYYYVNGVKQTGWIRLDQDGDGNEEVHFLDPALDGRAYHNIAVYMEAEGQTEKQYLKFGANGLYKGVANNEIVNDGNGYIYVKDNEKQTGLQLIDRTGEIPGEEQYLFDENGYLLLGVQKIEATKLGLAAGALGDLEGKYYNFGTSGVFNFNLETKKNGKYDTASTNALAEGIYDSRYYKAGEMKTNYLFPDTENNVYYFDTDGEMAKAKFVELETGKHYFDNSGKMIKGTADKNYELELDGTIYTIDANGKVINEAPAPTEGE